ncbi:hypothetical protein RD149_18175 [Gordonia westfalica]|uniref:Transposase n=1 Tax=Gordonia westfalica TaxID=158898 RepID=A0ABU2GW68_9ACTN|nr:hypothetical protein [Gordonia westfalica]MDS1115681.1 hypothetical protein [Gordonia westfalica]
MGVLGEYLSSQFVEAALTSPHRQIVKKRGTYAVVLMIVCDDHRNLTTVGSARAAIPVQSRRCRHQVCDSDQSRPAERTECEMPAVFRADVRRQGVEIA